MKYLQENAQQVKRRHQEFYDLETKLIRLGILPPRKMLTRPNGVPPPKIVRPFSYIFPDQETEQKNLYDIAELNRLMELTERYCELGILPTAVSVQLRKFISGIETH